jgi:hypothetical protein
MPPSCLRFSLLSVATDKFPCRINIFLFLKELLVHVGGFKNIKRTLGNMTKSVILASNLSI